MPESGFLYHLAHSGRISFYEKNRSVFNNFIEILLNVVPLAGRRAPKILRTTGISRFSPKTILGATPYSILQDFIKKSRCGVHFRAPELECGIRLPGRSGAAKITFRYDL